MADQEERLRLAREFIIKGQYQSARVILKEMPRNPTAVKWLEKLDEIHHSPSKPTPPRSKRSRIVAPAIRSVVALVIFSAIIVVAFVLGRFSGDKGKDEVPQVAVLPTLTPSLTYTPTMTLTFTQIPSATSTPTFTVTPSYTLTYTPTTTDTPRPTYTQQPTRVPTLDWRTAPTIPFYVISQMANIRACASTNCQVISQAKYREALSVVEQVSGESLQGNSIWLHVNLGTQDGYIHSSITSIDQPPPPTNTPQPTATPDYGSFHSPYPPGSWLQFEGGRIRETQIVRPANDMVASFNMFNSPPAVGSEYVLVWFEVYCQQQTCDPGADLDIRLIDESGQLWGESLFEVLEPDLDMMEGLRNSTLAGWQLFEFPIGQRISLIQIKWPKWFSDPLYVKP